MIGLTLAAGLWGSAAMLNNSIVLLDVEVYSVVELVCLLSVEEAFLILQSCLFLCVKRHQVSLSTFPNHKLAFFGEWLVFLTHVLGSVLDARKCS